MIKSTKLIRRQLLWVLLWSSILVLVGCRAPKTKYPEHIVAIDADGTLRTLASNHRLKRTPLPQKSTETAPYHKKVQDQLGYIFNNNDKLNAQTNILLFIQGGNITISDGVELANKRTKKIMKDKQYPAYPIFIAWNASLFSAWAEQYTTYRGQTEPTLGYLLSPWTAVENIGRFVSRLPLSVFEQAHAGFRTARTPVYGRPTAPEADLPRPEAVNVQYQRLRDLGYQVQFPSTNEHLGQLRLNAGIMLFECLPKVLSEGVVDTGGKIGWDYMLRRTQTMFTLSTKSSSFAPGGADEFAKALRHYIKHHPDKHVIIVGHSMGSIIANELIRRYGDDLHISRIVYMAAACGVDDCERTIIPFLLRHRKVQFYNLSLHPGNDTSELAIPISAPVSPRGSLLDWIDYYYSSTSTDYGWTLGKWDNVILGSKRFLLQQNHKAQEQLKTQIHLSCFGYGPESRFGPQHHGGFDQWAFWQPGFWDGDPCGAYLDH